MSGRQHTFPMGLHNTPLPSNRLQYIKILVSYHPHPMNRTEIHNQKTSMNSENRHHIGQEHKNQILRRPSVHPKFRLRHIPSQGLYLGRIALQTHSRRSPFANRRDLTTPLLKIQGGHSPIPIKPSLHTNRFLLRRIRLDQNLFFTPHRRPRLRLTSIVQGHNLLALGRLDTHRDRQLFHHLRPIFRIAKLRPSGRITLLSRLVQTRHSLVRGTLGQKTSRGKDIQSSFDQHRRQLPRKRRRRRGRHRNKPSLRTSFLRRFPRVPNTLFHNKQSRPVPTTHLRHTPNINMTLEGLHRSRPIVLHPKFLPPRGREHPSQEIAKIKKRSPLHPRTVKQRMVPHRFPVANVHRQQLLSNGQRRTKADFDPNNQNQIHLHRPQRRQNRPLQRKATTDKLVSSKGPNRTPHFPFDLHPSHNLNVQRRNRHIVRRSRHRFPTIYHNLNPTLGPSGTFRPLGDLTFKHRRTDRHLRTNNNHPNLAQLLSVKSNLVHTILNDRFFPNLQLLGRARHTTRPKRGPSTPKFNKRRAPYRLRKLTRKVRTSHSPNSLRQMGTTHLVSLRLRLHSSTRNTRKE